MTNDLKQILVILLRFILLYLVLLGGYEFYLNSQNGLDTFSIWVGRQSSFLQNLLGYSSSIEVHHHERCGHFMVNSSWVTTMVEGCNSISIMILFVSFVLAFYQGFKTFIFILIGLFLIHVMNVSRIALINIVAIDYKDYFTSAHDYLFPSIIYGTVIILWIVWIKLFVFKNEKN